MYVLDFSRRFNLAYHRNDGHVLPTEFSDRSQLLPERTLQVFEADLHGVKPGDRLHTSAARAHRAAVTSTRSSRTASAGSALHNSGPYNFGDEPQMLVRDFFELDRGRLPVARRHRDRSCRTRT